MDQDLFKRKKNQYQVNRWSNFTLLMPGQPLGALTGGGGGNYGGITKGDTLTDGGIQHLMPKYKEGIKLNLPG